MKISVFRFPLLAALVAFSLFAQAPAATDRSYARNPGIPRALAPIPPADPVAALIQKIENGSVQLAFDPATGYLPAVLKALNIPVESQMAVFSKTSVQADRIQTSNPRVLFFNDAVTVGWVRGGYVELASHDPRLGVVFYALDQSPANYRDRSASATPVSPFTHRQDCLYCHMTSATLGVPGMLLRSVVVSGSGVPLEHTPQYNTDVRMPFEKLWGGWYVTGNSGPSAHMGNLVAEDEAHGPIHLDSLDARCPPNTRLTAYSDIVALMVFEHQARMTNLITRAGWDARLGKPMGETVNELVDYMLFTGEAPLKGEIEGTSGFAEVFASRGPRDSKGRSLRDLSLRGRLMRYPCSYMIYSEAFEALPDIVKDAIYRRLWQILSGGETSGAYSHLSREDRGAIVEILRDTKPGLPGYFRTGTTSLPAQ
ncbi:MAG: hypothetical protein ABSB15_15570 [Bryobacteraceae bacterium]